MMNIAGMGRTELCIAVFENGQELFRIIMRDREGETTVRWMNVANHIQS